MRASSPRSVLINLLADGINVLIERATAAPRIKAFASDLGGAAGVYQCFWIEVLRLR